MAKSRPMGDQPKKTNGDGPSPGSPQPAPDAAAAAQPQLTMLAIYVKDLSFESPTAPQSLQGPGQNPQLRVSVNVNAGPRGADVVVVTTRDEEPEGLSGFEVR